MLCVIEHSNFLSVTNIVFVLKQTISKVFSASTASFRQASIFSVRFKKAAESAPSGLTTSPAFVSDIVAISVYSNYIRDGAFARASVVDKRFMKGPLLTSVGAFFRFTSLAAIRNSLSTSKKTLRFFAQELFVYLTTPKSAYPHSSRPL